MPTTGAADYVEFGWKDAHPEHTLPFVLPRILELTAEFARRGCTVVGIDLSEQGIAIARRLVPRGRFEVLAADATLIDDLGEDPFDLIVSVEVVEHLYAPHAFAEGCFRALAPGGRFVLTTPYHGYVKNLALAVANMHDVHAHPLRQGGHIKFWSRATLTQLLEDTGFVDPQFRGAGRLPYLWKSMVMSADRPADGPAGGA
jgi:2-polyprenyl-3-methyl-5-hydroxy-6-metoxy-1,4-benzoquinol methylase